MTKYLKKYKAHILVVYIFLLSVHFGFKDHFFITGIIFYTFPLLLLIIALIPLFILFYSKLKIRLLLLGLAGLLSYLWFQNYYYTYENNTISESHSIMFWNIAKQEDYNIKDLKKVLETKSIDAILFVEAMHEDNGFNTEFKHLLKDYNIEFLEGNMLIAAKGSITLKNYSKEQNNYNINHLQIELEQNSYSIAIVDIYGNPLHNKRYALNKAITYSKDNNIDVIFGDFNTPFESVHFDNLKLNYKSLREYQNGVSATWPTSIPLLEIDQIWLNKKLTPLSLEKQYFKSSDHALLIGTFNSNLKN